MNLPSRKNQTSPSTERPAYISSRAIIIPSPRTINILINFKELETAVPSVESVGLLAVESEAAPKSYSPDTFGGFLRGISAPQLTQYESVGEAIVPQFGQ